MAAPMVAGTLALVRAVHPTWTYTQLINQVRSTVDKLSALAGKVVSGGRVNAAHAVGASSAATSSPQVVAVTSNTAGTNSVSIARLTSSEGIDFGTFTTDDVLSLAEESDGAIASSPVSPTVDKPTAPPAVQPREDAAPIFCDYFNLPSQQTITAPANEQAPSGQTSVRVSDWDALSVDTRRDRDRVDLVFALGGARPDEWIALSEGDGLLATELFTPFEAV